jgi:mercuric ion binding protein
MKTLKSLFAVFLMMTVSSITFSQTPNQKSSGPKTESFKVWGKCEMCKTRIESGLKLDGITKAIWDEKTQLVTVTYDPGKTSVDAMQKKLASIGHDTEKYKAPDDVYAKLPGCCHYERSR